jgi:glycosyltransferase involved in cell wall biosynthesis
MHILYPCNEYPPRQSGGIGTAVATLARAMAAAGHKATTIGVYDNYEPPIEEQGVTIYRLRRPRVHRLVNFLLARWQLHRAILEIHRSDPIDVIEWPDFDSMYWKPIPGVANVIKVHGTTMSHRIHGFAPRRWHIERLELRALRSIPNWVGVSHWFNEEWKQVTGVVPKRETVVYNPVNTRIFRPISEGKDRGLVLYAGGLRRRKGVQTLARAARIFLPRIAGSKLVLIGFPADMTEQEVRAEAGPVADKLEFISFMDQTGLARYMASAAVYAMPSLYESCGNTWLEAAACGVPVVGSILSCGPEVVLDDQTGLLANPDDPEDVAEKVVRLLRDEALAARLGNAGRQRAEELFSIEAAVRESQAFYEQCLQDRRIVQSHT